MELNLLWYKSKGHEEILPQILWGKLNKRSVASVFSLPARFKQTVKTLLRHFLRQEPARLNVETI